MIWENSFSCTINIESLYKPRIPLGRLKVTDILYVIPDDLEQQEPNAQDLHLQGRPGSPDPDPDPGAAAGDILWRLRAAGGRLPEQEPRPRAGLRQPQWS